MKTLIAPLLYIVVGCSQPSIKVIELQISKSAIPEGIAVDPETNNIFISSIHEDNVSRSTSDGKEFETILSRVDNGYSFGVGLDLWNDKLYALGRKGICDFCKKN